MVVWERNTGSYSSRIVAVVQYKHMAVGGEGGASTPPVTHTLDLATCVP